MHNELTRRDFFGISAAAGAAGVAAGVAGGMTCRAAAREIQPDQNAKPIGPTYPSTAPELTKEIVLVCHFNEGRVRELLKEDRSLALASWDWGFGDWESALGAASHMGNREIAGLLIAEGARPDLFTYAMFDHVDAVRAVCEATPGAQENLGPHGISLLSHAKHGKAARVQEYLESLGGADGSEPGVTEDDATLERFVGEYLAGTDRFEVSRHSKGWLGIERVGGSFRTLRRLSDLGFSPGGAQHVQVSFEQTGSRVTGLSIVGGKNSISAVRSGG